MRTNIALLAVAVMTIAGCSTTRHPVISQVDAAGTIESGVSYCLPRTLIEVTIASIEAGYEVTIEPKFAPDPEQRYSIHLRHREDSYDKLVVATTQAGLLTSIDLNHRDETPQIVQKIVETAAEAAKAVAMLAASDRDGLPRHMKVIIDPATSQSLDRANDALAPFGFHVDIIHETSAARQDPARGPALGDSFYGVRYVKPRLATIVLVDEKAVKVTTQGQDPTYLAAPVMSTIVPIAQAGEVFQLPLPAGPYVETAYKLSFEHGMLTSYDATRPSESLGFASILPNALKTIVAIPSDLVQLKINTTKSEAELLQQQKILLEAQKALVEAQRALAETSRKSETDTDNPI